MKTHCPIRAFRVQWPIIRRKPYIEKSGGGGTDLLPSIRREAYEILRSEEERRVEGEESLTQIAGACSLRSVFAAITH